MRDLVESTDQCVFCGIVAGAIPCVKVAEDATTFAFMDIDPGSDGHLLEVPKRHSADGINLLNCCGAEAWQTVFHFHFHFHFHLHVIPRYRDSANRVSSWPKQPL